MRQMLLLAGEPVHAGMNALDFPLGFADEGKLSATSR
jgi:hypothetical protein